MAYTDYDIERPPTGTPPAAPTITAPAAQTAPVANTGLTVSLQRPTAAGSSAEAIGQQLDTAKAAPITRPPGLAQERANPGAIEAYKTAQAAQEQNVAGLQKQYEDALGNPKFGALAGVPRAGGGFGAAGHPELYAPPAAPMMTAATASPAPAGNAPVITAPLVATRTAPQSGTINQDTPSFIQPPKFGMIPAATQPAAITAPPLASTAPYQPVKSTVGKDGTISITGSGQSPEYLARMQAEGRDQSGSLIKPPPLGGGGKLPDFDAYRLMSPSKRADLAEYMKLRGNDAGTGATEATAQHARAGTQATLAGIQTSFNADQRANLDSEVKVRKQQALETLSLGPASPTNPNGYQPQAEIGLRLLAGASEKYKSALMPIPGTKNEGTGKPEMQLVLFDASNGHTIDASNGQTLSPGSGKEANASRPAKTQAPQAAIDHLKKNPSMKEAFKQKYGYLPPGM